MASPSATDPVTPVAPLSTPQVLEDAADLLLIHGRCKVVAKDKDGRLCVVGAVMAARGHDVQLGPVTCTSTLLVASGDFQCGYQDPAVGAIREHLLGRSPAIWNDTTEDDFEVIDTLRHVAKELRNEAVV